MCRRFLLFLLASASVALLLLAAMPLWLGVALRQIGGEWGIAFSRYERIGYAGFALHDITYERPEVRVTVDRGEGLTPALWMWRLWRGGEVKVSLGNWAVEVRRPPEPRAAAARPRGWVPLRALLARITDPLDSWIPRAQIGAGTVRWPAGEVTLSAATWGDRALAVEDLGFRGATGRLTLVWPRGEDRLKLSLRAVGDWALELESRGVEVTGEASLWGMRAPVQATFAPQGWLPREALLQASGWEIPAARLKLAELYQFVRGDARLEWQGAGFSVDVAATGDPRPERTAPPLQVNLRARGTSGEITVEALKLHVPGLSAELSAPVIADRSGRVRGGGAHFSLSMDLAQQPWLAARGLASGEATVVSGMDDPLKAEFRFAAREVVARGIALSEVTVAGHFEWPRILLSDLVAVDGAGGRLIGRGGWDFKTQSILDAVLEGEIRRASLERWLPDQPGFDSITVKAAAAGPWPEVEHRGEAHVKQLKFRGVNPVAARIDWQGRGAHVESFRANLDAAGSSLVLGGTADPTRVEFREITLAGKEGTLMELERPAVLRWRPALEIDALHLAGPEGALDVSLTWGGAGRIGAGARAISSAWLREFIPMPGPSWKIEQFAFSGEWNDGPMVFTMGIEGTVDLGEGRIAAVSAAGGGDRSGVRIDALRAAEGETTVFNATGRVPATLHPGTAKLLHMDPRGLLEVDATAVPHAAFWSKMAAASGVELREPGATVHVTGTWERPEGEFSLRAASILIDPLRVKRDMPAIESLDLQVSAKRDGIELKTVTLTLEGQPVRAQGRMPVPEGGWSRLVKEPWVALRRDASLRLEVPEADVSAFARLVPAILAPQGRLEADVTYERGELGGRFQLRDAASRPLGPLGVLQEINADVGLSGRTVTFHSVSAKSGGQPVTLEGTVEISEKGETRYDLALVGDNLPFVRQTGLLLRGDIDLKLQSPRQPGPPRITGSVVLRDSLFLQDVRAFLPRGGGGLARRPPYFSVEATPINAWVLAVEVNGNEFLRVRTPVFNGVASARFRLGGTLGEPRAIGEVTLDGGLIRMPFATFEVSQGSVRLTEANPLEPVIYVRGTSRRFGYDLAMEIEGNASSPNMEFSSSPALDSEQVLLMVMTGAVPSSEVTYSGTQRVARLGAFLGQSILGSLGADATSADRLGIAAGEKISRQGRETYEIEYRLSDRWTAIGEYNEYDEYNAGLKWRIYPRKDDAPPDEPAPEGGTDAPR